MRVFRLILLGAAALLLALLLAGYLNHLHPALDSVSHFRLHLAAVAIVAGLALIALRSTCTGTALVTIAVLAMFSTLWPSFGTGKAQASDESRATYRLLQANLRFDNKTPEDFIRLIGETAPDVITLAEVSWNWQQRLMSVSAMYPHQLICPVQNKYGGVAIFSRRPFVPGGLSFCDKDSAVAGQAVDIAGQTVTIVAMHLEWPWPKLQPEQIVWLKPEFQQIRDSGHPVLIGGDMNAVPWSAAVENIARETDTQILPQIWGTWFFNGLPNILATWFGLPIDNILTGKNVMVRSAVTQRSTGSDHRAILLEFSLQPDQETDDLGDKKATI